MMEHSQKRNRTEFWCEALIPLVILILGTTVFFFSQLDIDISKVFYDIENKEWWLRKHPVINLSYIYGPIISAIVSFWALFQLFASYVSPKYMQKRAVSLFILLCIVVGPVLITNGVVKETWRRPRPRDITQFHGNHKFQKVLQIGERKFRGKSFPSGHASAGFILVMLYFWLKKRRPKIAWLSLVFALALGSWLGFVRIVTGGHFASDCLWAFGLNWYVVFFLYYWWFLPYEKKLSRATEFLPSAKRHIFVTIILFLGIGLLAFRFLFSTPFRIEYTPQIVQIPSQVKKISLTVRANKGDIDIRRGKPGEVWIKTWISGHALPNIQADRTLDVVKSGDHWKLEYKVKRSGIAYEYQSHNILYVPPNVDITYDLFTKLGSIFRRDLEK